MTELNRSLNCETDNCELADCHFASSVVLTDVNGNSLSTQFLNTCAAVSATGLETAVLQTVLALADVMVLSRAITEFYRAGRTELLERYSATCLRRVWRAQRFSWWMTQVFHLDPSHNAFDRKRQLAELDYVTSSEAAKRSLAENYAGLPVEI